MGEIAEDMIDGTCCEICGQYFVDKDDNLYTHGYSVTCKECWGGKEHQKAKANTL